MLWVLVMGTMDEREQEQNRERRALVGVVFDGRVVGTRGDGLDSPVGVLILFVSYV